MEFVLRHPSEPDWAARCGHDGSGYFVETTACGVRLTHAAYSTHGGNEEALHGALHQLDALGFFTGDDLDQALVLAPRPREGEPLPPGVALVLDVIDKFTLAGAP